MRLRNYTDIPDDWIRSVIRAVCPPGVAGFDVRISNRAKRGARGRAYSRGSGYHDRACPFIVVSISRTDAGCRIRWRPRRPGYLPMDIGSRRETLVIVIAHELRHLWQARVPRGRRVWGARGQFSERDADAYALQMLRKFRRGELLAKTRDLISGKQDQEVVN